MTEQIIIRKGGKMNTISNVEILKSLLPEPSRSIYALRDDLKEKLGGEKVNYPTLRRHINKFVKEGLIDVERGTRKNGKPDKRGTQNLSLSFKGLVYLILKSDLTESESRTIVNRVLAMPHFKKLEMAKDPYVQLMSIDSLKESFSQLRPRVNLEFFDEDYVRELLFENLILQNCLDNVLAWKKEKLDKLIELPDRLSKRELRILKKKAKKDAGKISNEEINRLFAVYDYLREKQVAWNEKIDLLQKPVRYFKKRGIKP